LREGIPTPSTAVPTAVPTFEVPDTTTNILLLGSDTAIGNNDTRTDTMIIVSIDQDGPTASMISLPRDLYVYIPGKIMNRLNTALSLGGVDLLKQTILYNFGIPIHYYARVDFQGFETAVDAIGGVDIAVSCRLQDWRLISPELDPQEEDNWEQFALEPGQYHMDGDTALWFARSRLSTNDFDRGRRQQQLLRALLNEGVDLGLLSQFSSLWDAYKQNVETDLDIGRILQLATLAPAIRQNGVQHLYLVRGIEPWETPSGAQVQLPVWEGENNLEETFSRLFRVPALNRANRRPVTVEIVNASGNPDMALLAADNLAWYGFIPIISEELPEIEPITQMYYYRPNFKDSFDWMISWIFDMYRSEIQLTEDETFSYEYRVVLGEDYDPCLNQLYQPQEFLN
jgi:LCP family protein required for cell wall assembly